MATSELIAFVLACIDEDETKARAATQGKWHRNAGWSTSPAIDAGEYDTVVGPGDVACMSHCYGGSSQVEIGDEDAAHITRWDPVRVLDEVDAKRAMVRACVAADSGSGWAGWALLLLAHPYADRRGFRPEWRVLFVDSV